MKKDQDRSRESGDFPPTNDDLREKAAAMAAAAWMMAGFELAEDPEKITDTPDEPQLGFSSKNQKIR